jgi:ribosomal protein S17E
MSAARWAVQRPAYETGKVASTTMTPVVAQHLRALVAVGYVTSMTRQLQTPQFHHGIKKYAKAPARGYRKTSL